MVSDDLHRNIKYTASEAASIALESFASQPLADLSQLACSCRKTIISRVNIYLVDTKARGHSLLASWGAAVTWRNEKTPLLIAGVHSGKRGQKWKHLPGEEGGHQNHWAVKPGRAQETAFSASRASQNH